MTELSDFDRRILGRIDEIERNNRRWMVHAGDIANPRPDPVLGADVLGINAIEAAFRRLSPQGASEVWAVLSRCA